MKDFKIPKTGSNWSTLFLIIVILSEMPVCFARIIKNPEIPNSMSIGCLVKNKVSIVNKLDYIESACFQQQTSIKEQIEVAKSLNRKTDYTNAILVLNKLTNEQNLTTEQKQTIYWELACAYTAKKAHDKVDECVRKMLEFEPPPVKPNEDDWPTPIYNAYCKVKKNATGSYSEASWNHSTAGLKTIALLDFDSRVSDLNKSKIGHLPLAFSDLLNIYLKNISSLNVVEKARLKWLMEDIKQENDPTLFDQNTVVRMGKLIGAHAVVFGSFIENNLDNTIIVTARVIFVETGVTIVGESIEGKPKNLSKMAKELTIQLCKNLEVEFDQLDDGISGTRSLDAELAFSEGLYYLDREQYKNAFEKFQEALDIDPKFERARKRANSTKFLIP